MNTEQQITAAAIDLFKKEGFEHVTIPMICEKAGVSKGTFYYHFQSKNDIIYVHIDSFMEDIAVIMPDILKLESPKEQLWMLYKYAFQNIVSLNANLLKAFYIVDMENGLKQLSVTDGASFGYHSNIFNKLLISLIEKAQDVGEITKEIPAKTLTVSYASAIVGTGLDWACHKGNYDEIGRLKEIFGTIYR